MTGVQHILDAVRAGDLTLWLEAGELRYRAPRGRVTAALLAQIRERKRDLIALLRDADTFLADAPPIRARQGTGPAPLSFAQERLLFVEGLGLANAAYTLPLAFRLDGPLDVSALEQSLSAIIARHDSLRTHVAIVDGVPRQIVGPASAVQLAIDDLTDLSPPAREEAAEAHRLAERAWRFDLMRGPLCRVRLLQLSRDAHVLLLTLHHSIADGWSIGVLLRELGLLYRAAVARQAVSLPPVSVQYADYAEWQRAWLQGPVLEQQLTWWRTQLADAATLALPTDRPRPMTPSFRGAAVRFTVPRDVTAMLERVAQEAGATLFMVLLAALQVLLARWTGQRDIVVGSPIAGRRHREIEDTVGCFLNMLALRVDLRGRPAFRTVLARVKEVTLGAYAHQDLPFEQLVAALQPQRDLSRQPLFQVDFTFQNLAPERLTLPDVTVQPITGPHATAKFDLTFVMQPDAEGLAAEVEYALDLFDEATVERLVAHWRRLLSAAAADATRSIWDLPLLGEDERAQIVKTSSTIARYPVACVHDAFAAQAARRPDAIALVSDDVHVSYAQLQARANQVAHALRALGVGPDVTVGLCIDRSIELIVGLFGILEAGGAYVPMDPAHPEERLAFMLTAARARVVLTHGGAPTIAQSAGIPHAIDLARDAAALAAQPTTRVAQRVVNGAEPASETGPAHLAYVMYTSGSTGRPKGVGVTHANVTRLFSSAAAAEVAGTSDDVWTWFHAATFDFSVWEVFGALLHGARLVIVPRAISRSPASFAQLIDDEAVTIVSQTPSAFTGLLEADAAAGGARCGSVRCVVFGGEALQVSSLGPWFTRHGDRPALINMYGITETTVHVTARRLAPQEPRGGGSPIGRPLPDLSTYVMDAHGELAPVGVVGELYVGGGGVARGYDGQAALTAERFVPHPFAAGERLYRTGDLARWTNAGELEFLGRADAQVKIRGYRIELGEIEAALRDDPRVAQAVVVMREDAPGDRRLVAYVVWRADAQAAETHDVRRRSKERLPEQLVPAAIVALDRLPMTANGKLDRRALPPPEGRPDEVPYVAPRSSEEALLARVWAAVLRLPHVGVRDDFFDLGGDSILMLRVQAETQKYGYRVSLPEMFATPRIEDLARTLVATTEASRPARLAPFSLLAPDDRQALQSSESASDIEDAYPLSRLQAGMVFHNLWERGSAMYHDVASATVESRLDEAAMTLAIQAVVDRHPILRTTFHLSEYTTPLQCVHRTMAASIVVEDWTARQADGHELAVRAFVEQEARRTFDLARGPLATFFLHRLDADRFQFTLGAHHAILDGWSVALLLREVFEQYATVLSTRRALAPRPLAGRYRDFVAAEQRALTTPAHAAHWEAVLGEWETSALWRLPAAARAGEAAADATGAVRVAWADDLSERVVAFARRAGVPVKSVFFAAHLNTMRAFMGGRRVFTGLVTNARVEEEDGEKVLGLFLNTVPVRFTAGAGTWEDLAWHARQIEETLLPHRSYPLVELYQAQRETRTLDVIFNYVNFHNFDDVRIVEAAGTRLCIRPSHGVTQIDVPLAVNVDFETKPARGGMLLLHRPDRCSRAQAERIAELFELTLRAMVEQPGEAYAAHELLSPRDRAQIAAWNARASRPSAPPPLVHDLVRRQAQLTPEASAVVFGDETISYAALDARADTLARQLRELGVTIESRVGLCLDRGPGMIVAVLAAFKAGAAYVPLDPQYPSARLAFMLRDARVEVLLTQEWLANSLREAVPHIICVDGVGTSAADLATPPETVPPEIGHPETLAYITYTSGSTGVPKGVAMTHGALANLIAWQLARASRTSLGRSARTLQFTSLSFDVSVQEIFGTLCAGGCLVLIDDETRHDMVLVWRAIRIHRVQRIFLPFAVLQQLADAGLATEAAGCLGEVITAGEQLHVTPALRRFFDREACALDNHYGPSETHAASAYGLEGPPRDWPAIPPIGAPIANASVHVLNEQGQVTPIGVVGEVFVGGAGLARGYFDRPALTAERFVPDPTGGLPHALDARAGGRVYRTGDLAWWRDDGEIEFVGRGDDQVKLRGFRIEPGEVTAVLQAQPEVADAAVVVREDTPGVKQLVAYIVFRPGASSDPGGLRHTLQARLPAYLVPSAFVVLDRLPVTTNGKLDRRALPAPSGRPDHQPYVAPRTPLDMLVASVWEDVLGTDAIGLHDDFFDRGGHSLAAMRVLGRIRELLHVDVPARVLFEAPTVAELASRLDAAQRAGAGVVLPPVTPRSSTGPVPASFAQERLWFVEQLGLTRAAYTLPLAMRLEGALDVGALEQSLAAIVDRHQSLRTHFTMIDGTLLQIIDPAQSFRLDVEDLTDRPTPARDTAAQLSVQAEIARRFDLSRGPLCRFRLLRLAAETHVLLITLHHTIADGWSIGVLLRELSAIHRRRIDGDPTPLPALPVQYADYAAWQHEWLRGEVLDAQLAYWRTQLADLATLVLPTDRPRPPAPSFRGATTAIQLSPALTSGIERLARDERTTMFMVLLAALQVLLARWSGQQDIVVGSPIAGRRHRETEGLIGFFVNMLVLRADLGGRPGFRTVLARVKESTLGAYAHQDLPFEKLVATLQPGRDLSRQPLFQVNFTFHDAAPGPLDLPGVSVRPLAGTHTTAKFDLTVAIQPGPSGLGGGVEYATDLFDRATIDRLIAHWERLLTAVVRDASTSVWELPLLSDEDRRQVVERWNASTVPCPSTCVHEQFAALAAQRPDAIALAADESSVSYATLDARANAVAHALRRAGVWPDVVVGLCVDRSIEMIVGLLGIMKAGGAYLPLDPTHPPDRLTALVTDARAALVVTRGAAAAAVAWPTRVMPLADPATLPDIAGPPRQNTIGPAQLAYVTFTSGSTGRPKGVSVTHRNIARLVSAARAVSDQPAVCDERDSVLLLAPLAFDASTFEIWGALLTGARAVIAPSGPIDLARLRHLLQHEQISVLWLTAGLFHQAVETCLPALTAVRTLLAGGDVLSTGHVQQVVARLGAAARLINGYGPTEGTTFSSWHVMSRTSGPMRTVPIGAPLANGTCYVLDPRMTPVPPGVVGELHIGGDGLARGYRGDPRLTASRFVPDPFGRAGARLYRTGDLARWRADGQIEFVGRADDQVKLRGFRVEPAEVAAALREHPDVADAAVVVREDGPGEKRLVAYVVWRAGASSHAHALRQMMLARLPSYLVPSAIVVLDELPVTPNGKVDRRALPAPEGRAADVPYVAPRSPLEVTLAAIWRDVLHVDRVGLHDDFFESGGDSLLATRVVAQIHDRLPVDLPLRAMFEGPTIAALAALVEDAQRAGAGLTLPPLVAQPRSGPVPVSFAQERLWMVERMGLAGPTYAMPLAFRCEGALDAASLEQSLATVVARHESLRTHFATIDGASVQVITPPGPFRLQTEDLSALPEAARVSAVDAHQAELARPLDLTRGPLFRSRLLRLSAETHLLLITLHHSIADGWSLGVLMKELGDAYSAGVAGHRPALPPLPVQYGDYAVWQRGWLQGEVLDTQLSYWRTQLADLTTLALPTDRPRPAVPSYRGGTTRMRVPDDVTIGLEHLARESGATMFMVLLAALQVLLGRWSGQRDIVVGSPIAGRRHRETEGLIGFFVNMLVLRADLRGRPSFRTVLARVKEATLGAYAHQDLPFEKLVADLQPVRDLSRQPLFQVNFTFDNLTLEPLHLPGITVQPVPGPYTMAKFDLGFAMQQRADGLAGGVEYATDLFDEATVERLTTQWQRLLTAVAADATQMIWDVPLLNDVERREILGVGGQTIGISHPVACLHDLFASQVRQRPEAIAVVAEDAHVSYAMLEARATALAHRLRRCGVGPEVVVGLHVGRSVELIVGVLGILMAGGAYLPLDPTHPAERLTSMVADARAPVVVTATAATHTIVWPAQVVDLSDAAATDCTVAQTAAPADSALAGGDSAPEQLAYVMFTSGSTGRPKGVSIEHRHVARLFAATDARFAFTPDDIWTLFHAFTFDFSVWEIWGALLYGGRLVVVPHTVTRDPAAFARLVDDEQVTVLNQTPSAFEGLMQVDAATSGGCCATVRWVVFGGEALQVSGLDGWLTRHGARRPMLVNMYGITETTVHTTLRPIEASERRSWSPIGRPLSDLSVHVLDDQGELAPPGVVGELYVGGAGVARGYQGQPGLTADRFVPDPFAAGARLYRTGDLGRWTAAGGLEFVGRADAQVKIRGHRIELGEIEAVLRGDPEIAHAVVIAREDVPGEKRLVAYVVWRAGGGDVHGVRSRLKERLPEYLVPAAVVALDRLPVTANGKLDRRALPAPEGRPEEVPYVAPRTAEETLLVRIWAEVLRVPRVGVHDDFFDLGGDSILALRAQAEVQKAGYALSLPDLFAAPRIEELAARLVASQAAAKPDAPAPFDMLSPRDHVRLREDRNSVAYRGDRS